jgi:hypothetical protein
LCTPTSARTTLALTTTLTAPKQCQLSPSTLWSKHPLTRRPPFGPPRPLRDPSPLALLSLWWSSTKTTLSPSSTLPRASLPPYERGISRMPWLLKPLATKYPTLNNDWIITETRSPFRPATVLKGTWPMMRQGHQTSSSRRGTESINRHTGSSSWPRGK